MIALNEIENKTSTDGVESLAKVIPTDLDAFKMGAAAAVDR